MNIIKKVIKIGNSDAVIIPKHFLKHIKFDNKNDLLELDIKKIRRKIL